MHAGRTFSFSTNKAKEGYHSLLATYVSGQTFFTVWKDLTTSPVSKKGEQVDFAANLTFILHKYHYITASRLQFLQVKSADCRYTEVTGLFSDALYFPVIFRFSSLLSYIFRSTEHVSNGRTALAQYQTPNRADQGSNHLAIVSKHGQFRSVHVAPVQYTV